MISKALFALVIGLSTLVGCAKSDGGDNAANSPDNEIVAGSKCKTKAGSADCSSQSNRAKAISREAFAIKDLLQSGMHDFARGKTKDSSDPMELVKMFIRHSTGDDDFVKDYKFKTDLKDFPSDEQVAGLFQAATAVDRAVSSVSTNDDFNKGTSEKIHTHLNTLKDLGVVFGSDGLQQNGCAAPTLYLLVIDPVGKTVDGIDQLLARNRNRTP